MENIQNKSALIPSDEIRSEELLAEQKFEAFITSLAHIIEKYGMRVLGEVDGAAWESQLYIGYFPKVNFGGMNYEPIWKTLCFVSEGQHRDASGRIQPGRSKKYADTICGS